MLVKISDRLSDFGVVGAFFWTLLGAVCYLFGFLPARNELDATTLAALGVPALAVVFTTGLFLDVFSSRWFEGVEIDAFASHLKENEHWIDAVLQENKNYSRTDMEVLVAAGNKQKKSKLAANLGLWSPETERPVATAYGRMQSLFLSAVSIGGKGEPELLKTQLSFWNAMRAISFSCLLSSAVISALLPIFWVWVGDHPTQIDWHPYLDSVLIAILLLLLGSWSSWISLRANERVCRLLFASAYVVMGGESSQLSAKAATAK